MEQLTNARLATIKSIQNTSIRVEDILRVDLEAHKRGVLILSVTGKLVLISWINKKLEHKEKVIEDISDALWQRGDENEVFILCHSGAFLRYNLLNDTGITCSLQLSAPSVLNLIREKDSTIHSIKSQKLWGHTERLILMQPQSDRLVLFSTNSGDRPTLLGVLRTPPLRSAHIVDSKVIVQPITGSDLYVYGSTQCKPLEVISLVYPHREMAYTEWGSLSCSSNGTFAALTDSERHLYLALMESKESYGKKGGLPRRRVVLRQIVWPSVVKPITLLHLSLTCSEDMLSLFCTKTFHNTEKSYYLTCKWRTEGSLSLIYEFSKPTCLIPSISNDSLDLFLTQDGVCMLIDQDNSLCNREREPNLDNHLAELETGFQNLDLAKIAQFKTNIEQDLAVFLSSCNYRENWKDLADLRGRQHAQLADIILSHLTKLSANNLEKSSFIALREMFKHHFQSLQEDIRNVIKYVDGDEITQILLQMAEQIGFFYESVEGLSLPEGKAEDQTIMENFQLWQDQPIEDVILYAIENGVLQAAEVYLKMKPWIYGTIDTDSIISLCIQVSLKHPSEALLNKLDRNYANILKRRLFASQIPEEIQVLTDLLKEWNVLSEQDCLASHLVLSIIAISPSLLHSCPKFWNRLVCYGEEGTLSMDILSIADVTNWNRISILMVLADLYARTHIENLIEPLSSKALWAYSLLRNDQVTIKKWILKYFSVPESSFSAAWPDMDIPEDKEDTHMEGEENEELDTSSLFYSSIGGDDTDSMQSFQSSWTENVHQETNFPYLDIEWEDTFFESIDKDMIDAIGKAKPMFMEYALIFLSHYGLYITDEQHQLQKILLRRTFLPSCFKDVDDTCDVAGRLSDKGIHDMVLRKMAAHNLYLPFFEYVNANNLDVSDTELHLPDRNWYDLVNPFLKITKEQTKQNLFDLSIKGFDYLLSVNESKLNDIYLPLFITMLLAPNASLAHFLHKKPVTNDDIQKEVEEIQRIMDAFRLTPNTLIDGLSQSHSFLQPLKKNPYQEQELELTMYDLLHGNVSFDMNSLFTWQPENRFGYVAGAKMPNFSDADHILDTLAAPKIDYVYYLKNGRPCFALVSVLKEIHSGKTLSKVEDVKGGVYGTALTCWPDMQTCTACVFFLHFTDQKCESLRNILYAANTIIELKSGLYEKIEDQQLVKHQLQLWTEEIQDVLYSICNVRSRNRGVSELIKQLEISAIQFITDYRYILEDLPKPGYPLMHRTEDLIGTIDGTMLTERTIHYILRILKICDNLYREYKTEVPVLLLKTLARSDCWTLFLGVAEFFQFPKRAVLEASSMFSSVSLKEHVQLSLRRLYGYTKDSDHPGTDNQDCSLTILPCDKADAILETEDQDFIEVIIQCFNTEDPARSLLEAANYWKVSAYAVLAACLRTHDVKWCFFIWLLAEIPNKFIYELKERYDVTLDDIFGIIRSELFPELFNDFLTLAVKNGFLDILEMGVHIFYDEHVLITLLQALQLTKNGSSQSDITEKLQSFPANRNSLKHLDSLLFHIVGLGIDEYLGNNHLKRTFISSLCSVPDFPGVGCVNWNCISHTLEHLQYSVEKVNVYSLMEQYRNSNAEECAKKLVKHFTGMKQFEKAFEISAQYGLSSSEVLLAKLSLQFRENRKVMETKERDFLVFLESCHNELSVNEIPPSLASTFFVMLSEECEHQQSKFNCLRYATVWIPSGHSERHSIDYKMWLAALDTKLEDQKFHIHLEPPPSCKAFFWQANNRMFYQYDLESVMDLSSLSESRRIFTDDKIKAGILDEASILVDRCLQEGFLVAGCRIAHHFKLEHMGLEKVLEILCTANEIVPQQNSCSDLSSFVVITKRGDISAASSYHSKDSNACSITSRASTVRTSQDSSALINLKTKCSDVIHGQGIITNVILLAQVAEACSMSFLGVIRENSTKEVLYEILSLGHHQIHLAKEFIKIAEISPEDVTQMLVDEIIASLDSDDVSPTFFLDASNFDERFEKFLPVVKDPILCGNLLLAKVKDYADTSSMKSYHNSIELVILAHKCFSRSANIEGIGLVLQISQTLVKKLEKKGLWSLMARLLTGVRRYSELHYVIDTLKKNGEFEHLLKKISDTSFKTSGLDRELIHYLKSQYPDDKESLKMVVHHFSMHAEVAQNWMEEARTIVEAITSDTNAPVAVNMKKINRSRSKEPLNSIAVERVRLLADEIVSAEILWNVDVSRLNEAVKCYSYAAEYFSMIEEFANAMKCVHQAELVALQIALVGESKELKSGLRIINLAPSQLKEIQTRYLNVQEISVFCDAYGTPPCWAVSICHHYIVNGRQQFLEEFCYLHCLSSSIVLELAAKMESLPMKSDQLKRLGQLLGKVRDPELVYRVASQFKLVSTLQECLEKPSAAYLKDNVFKHGLSQL